MTLTEKQIEGQNLLQTLVNRAKESTNFKNQLISNPKATIEKATGRKFKDLKRIKIAVEDQSDTSLIYFNIPAMPNLDELELSDEQLELVAGGITPTLAATPWTPAAIVAVGSFAAGVGLYAATH